MIFDLWSVYFVILSKLSSFKSYVFIVIDWTLNVLNTLTIPACDKCKVFIWDNTIFVVFVLILTCIALNCVMSTVSFVYTRYLSTVIVKVVWQTVYTFHVILHKQCLKNTLCFLFIIINPASVMFCNYFVFPYKMCRSIISWTILSQLNIIYL